MPVYSANNTAIVSSNCENVRIWPEDWEILFINCKTPIIDVSEALDAISSGTNFYKIEIKETQHQNHV